MCNKDNREEAKLLSTVQTFTNDIIIYFVLDKCAKALFLLGKLTQTSDIIRDSENIIKKLGQEKSYMYSAVDEENGFQHAKMKEKIRQEYYRK